MTRAILFLTTLCTLALGLAEPPRVSQSGQVTFTADIKPLIDRKCISCHVKGGSAPFPLQTYAQVKKRGDLCRRMILTRMMPPCTAVSPHGEFCEGGGPFTDDESVLLQNWMDAGAPEGQPSDPAPVRAPKEWRLGKPDVVLKPQAHIEVPEEGRPFWKAFVIPAKALEGRRLRAFDVQVAQPLVIRSIVVATARPGLVGTRRAAEGWETGGSLDSDAKKYLGVWAPGYPVWQLPKGVSVTLDSPAIVVQVLYLPLGKSDTGDFEVGLYFSKERKDLEAQWLEIGQEEFSVPAPGSLVLRPTGQLPQNSQLIAVFPEARFFCTSVRLSAGETLLFNTRRWEPYWQGPSRFEKSVEFPEGALLQAEFNYDNDIHMGRNEGRRPRPILSGPRERDELCRMHVLYVQKKLGR